MRTRVKFCGMIRPEDARVAADCGVDAVGVIFYPKASAAADVDVAIAVGNSLPPFVELVALFVNAEPDYVRDVIAKVHPGCLQFHGDENGDYCRMFNHPYIKACRAGEQDDITRCIDEFGDARGILLDTKVAGKYGGSGKVFDWTLIPPKSRMPLIVAGGLSAENVGGLISQHRPFAVDVAGGIAMNDDKRQKDHDKMKAFMEAVRHADGN